jgi:hypothetical protein
VVHYKYIFNIYKDRLWSAAKYDILFYVGR